MERHGYFGMKLLSVAIPCYNSEGYVKKCIEFAKENEFYKIKGGVLDGKVVTVDELTVLAQLPSREELIAKLAGCLLANVSKLAATLDAVRVKKESEE